MSYTADAKRYENNGLSSLRNSGLKLPELSLGLWHNFGDTAVMRI